MMKTKPCIFRLTLGIILILLIGVSLLPMLPPRAVQANAPASRFSAERAMADLAVVAREPHSAGSPAQEKVRTISLARSSLSA
jgi:hypothetical protein